MGKIQYENKVALLENADIPDINKVKADDMNEIKQVVNENDDKFLTNGLNVSNEVDEDYRTNIIKGNWDYSPSPLVSYGTSKSNITNGIRITCTQSAQNIGSYMEIPIQLLGKTTKFNAEITPSASNKGRILFSYLNDSNAIVSSILTINESGSYDITFASSLPSGATKIGALFYGNSNGTASINDYVDYTDIELWNGEASIVVDNEEIYNQNLMNYSANETRIGTWLGKPLYRKVVETTLPDASANGSTATKTIAHNIVNAELVWFKDAFSKNNNETLSFPYFTSAGYRVWGNASTTTIFLYNQATFLNSAKTWIVLEYTKTTD